MDQRWPGYCPICQREVTFVLKDAWARDFLFCDGCWSVPRQRAMIHVLDVTRPRWREERLWELAPAGPASALLARQSRGYVGTQYWPDVKPGSAVDGVRCEDIERPSFPDASVDIVVCSDVFEHVFDADVALQQVARILADGGVMIWTVPRYLDLEVSRRRAVRTADGVEHLLPVEYHGDPVNDDGILVTFDWGQDLAARIKEASGMTTVSYKIDARELGIVGEFIEVFATAPALHTLSPRAGSRLPDAELADHPWILDTAERDAKSTPLGSFVKVADDLRRQLSGTGLGRTGWTLDLLDDRGRVARTLTELLGTNQIIVVDGDEGLPTTRALVPDAVVLPASAGSLALIATGMIDDVIVYEAFLRVGDERAAALMDEALRVVSDDGYVFARVPDDHEEMTARWAAHGGTVRNWVPGGVLFDEALVTVARDRQTAGRPTVEPGRRRPQWLSRR